MFEVDGLLERDGIARRQRMIGMHDHSKPIAMIGMRGEPAQIDGVPAHADIGAPFLDAAHHFPDLAFL